MASNPSPTPSQQATAAPTLPGGWLTRNLTTLVLVALGTLLLYYFLKDSIDPLDDLFNIGKVVIALGLVIFIHELGHFLAAKWCDVYVEAFSIGFGPPFLGLCSFKWGETTYKIGWIPLGGYVKMMGEGEDNEESTDDPRSYKNKKVWQRMIIISAGVVMNMILALVCYVSVYMTHGEDRNPGVVGHVAPGGPAWKKGIRPGTMIRQIGDRQTPYYDELQRVVMRAGKDREIPIVFDTFDVAGKSEENRTTITPARGDDILAPMLLLRSANIPVLARKLRGQESPVVPGSPASRAEPPLQFGDRIVGATDPDQPERVTPLRPDPRYPNAGGFDYFDLERRLQRLAGKPMVLQIERDGSSLEVKLPPAFSRTIGVRMMMGQIVAVRENSPASRAERADAPSEEPGILAKDGKTEGDILHAVEVKGKDGKPLRFTAEVPTPAGAIALDPVRLPAQLAQWAENKPDDLSVRLTVRRPVQHKYEQKVLIAKWDPTWDPFDGAPWAGEFPLSIAPLGLGYLVQTQVTGIDENSPAFGKLTGNELVKAIEFKFLDQRGKTDSLSKDLKGEDWGHYYSFFIQPSFRDGVTLTEVTLKLADDSRVTLQPMVDESWPAPDRGLIFEPEKRSMKADGVIDAIAISADRCATKMATIYENLHGIGRGRISVLAMGGPVTIADRAFTLAGQDGVEFILFIALININLAVVNFLPIPVLDGGHMVFLAYEALRGKPPSDRWRFILTIMGLVVVLGLMALTLGLDFDRFILPKIKRLLGW